MLKIKLAKPHTFKRVYRQNIKDIRQPTLIWASSMIIPDGWGLFVAWIAYDKESELISPFINLQI